MTNGEAWLFLRLVDQTAAIDLKRYHIDNAGGILAAFAAILGHVAGNSSMKRTKSNPMIEVALPV